MVYPAAHVAAPGVIHHAEGDRFPIGELDGKETERAKWVHDVLVSAGLKSRILSDIRSEIWLKAWGNLSFNPISALSHATLVEICQFPETRQLAADMMREAQAVALKLGIKFRHTIEKRIEGAESVGAHKTSMLQDVELGRSLETEALVGSILELAKLTDTPGALDPGGLRLRQAAQQGHADRGRRRAPQQGGLNASAASAGVRAAAGLAQRPPADRRRRGVEIARARPLSARAPGRRPPSTGPGGRALGEDLEAAHQVDGGAEHGEVEAIGAADVAVHHLADVEGRREGEGQRPGGSGGERRGGGARSSDARSAAWQAARRASGAASGKIASKHPRRRSGT